MAYTMAASLCSVFFEEKLTPAQLQDFLQSYCDQPLYLKLNENRSTMCSIRWESNEIKISLNRIFLAAPKNVIHALAKAIEKKNASIPTIVKAFIHKQLVKLDYSAGLDPSQLEHQGQVYNLKELYDSVNQEYFDGKLELKITWFSSEFKQNKSRFTFGLYFDALKLIKINRVMDTKKFPKYVIRYVIYHEMLHFVSPTYVDKAGIHRAHNKKFKHLEMQFKEYTRAKLWIQKHQGALFSSNFHLDLAS